VRFNLEKLAAAFLALWLAAPPAAPGLPAAPSSLAKTFSQSGFEAIGLRRTAEHHLYVVGKLNGRRRSVLVDTGWSFTTVSTNAARKLSAGHPGANERPAVLMADLQLGRVAFTNQPARVEHMVFDGRPASFEIVLGCDFLRRHFAVVDGLNRRLYTRRRAPTGLEQGILEAALRRNGFVDVKLSLKQPPAITCAARVNEQPLEMLVDTAALWSALDVRQLDRLGLRALPTAAKISGVGHTGTRGVAVGEAKSFTLGDVPVKNAHFAVMDLSDWGLAAPGKGLSEVQGILGGAELLANGALVDCGALKLWVRRSTAGE
jgi:predicted aspartyl protease